MSKLRSLKRHLNPSKVWLANHVAEDRIKVARQAVLDRAKKDAEFAADVLKAVGENLPKEIKEACEESVKGHALIVENPEAKAVASAMIDLDKESNRVILEVCEESKKMHEPIVGGDTTYKLTEVVQLDGGGQIMVDPNEEVMDGPNSAWEPPPTGVIDGPLPPEAQKLVDEHLVQEEGPKAEKV